MGQRTLLKFLPVEVKGPAGRYSTFALLDDGSTTTLVSTEVARRVGATGPGEVLTLRGLGPEAIVDTASQRVTLQITGKGSTITYPMKEVRTIMNLNLPHQTVTENDIVAWPHLRKIAFEAYHSAKPEILIGQDNWELSVPLKIMRAGRGAPVATLTALGWTVHGPVSPTTRGIKKYSLVSIGVDPTFKMPNDNTELHNLVKDYFSLESIGISNLRKPNYLDERAEQTLRTHTKRMGERWQTGLLWKDDYCGLPDNYASAYKRLVSLEKKLDKDPELNHLYTREVDNLIEQGYAREVDTNEPSSNRTWYLPHFAVRHASKPSKVRLVFDAAARTNGVSLNDKLLTGPDLLKSLPGVLMRFRQKPVAIKGDLKEMFLQIKVNKEDQQAQRFLWRGTNRDRQPDVYLMTSLIFGATSSPCTAIFVKNQNALEFQEKYPEATDAIVHKHYMDDYLDSVDTVSDARRIIEEVGTIHRKGGFLMRAWASNRADALQDIPTEHLAAGFVNLSSHGECKEKALGLVWNPMSDSFSFDTSSLRVNSDIWKGTIRPTKRQMLRLMMSVFDPLGFLLPLTTSCKILLQDVWRSGIGWDDQLKEGEFSKWSSWIQSVPSINLCHIPRCYFSAFPRQAELHVFCDASEKAYVAVAYWRAVNPDGETTVMFISGKSRVAPLKPVSIPKMELQAALVGARLAKTVQKEHEINVSRRVLWSDSQRVIKWIKGDPRSHTAFLAHRLGEIGELTEKTEWRWVPSQENPADDATRDKFRRMDSNMRWLTGPRFLKENEASWPATKEKTPVETHIVGTPTTVRISLALRKEQDFVLPDVQRFSSWTKLIRTTAWVLYVSDIAKRYPRTGLNATHLQKAEVLWQRSVQAKHFRSEIECIRKGCPLNPKSPLTILSPILDDQGLLRVGGRIDRVVNVPQTVRKPVILEGHERYTRLLIQHHHQQVNHASPEMVLNEIRQKYWIPKLRQVIRSVSASCQTCRVRRARPSTPRMGDLPTTRIDHHSRPFTNCGIDYFGPMEVTIGRRHEKRWGVIFTCMTTRAVHLEMAASLTTDSAIMAIRRMAARRGYPTNIYSDNGTNLRGAEAELRAALHELDINGLKEFVVTKGVTWHFIPPAAPNMGGSWERLIQCVKNSLRITLKERAPHEEVLATLLAEAEHTVNSRPLTHVSLDHKDDEALTPNHFLIGSSSDVPNVTFSHHDDICLKKKWRIAQNLADMFWNRWVREYLPTLIPRRKWPQDGDTSIDTGDVVVICDHTLPRNVWPKGVITKTFPGTDGRVRVVEIRTTRGFLRRPVSKIARLTTSNEGTG